VHLGPDRVTSRETDDSRRVESSLSIKPPWVSILLLVGVMATGAFLHNNIS